VVMNCLSKITPALAYNVAVPNTKPFRLTQSVKAAG